MVSSCRQQVDPFRFQHVAGVRQARLNIFWRQVVVLMEHVLDGPALPENLEDEFNGDPSASDHGLPHENLCLENGRRHEAVDQVIEQRSRTYRSRFSS